jgi:hypothetical protein
MTCKATEGACAFAWRNYLLLHSNISENDSRRSALYRYVSDLRDTCEYDFDLLQIAAVAYLKKLDELHEDRSARLAADQVISDRLESRRVSRDQQKRVTAATAIGMNALKPIMHFQVSMLRIWANSIERFAGNFEKELEETAITVEEPVDRQRAA